MAKFDFSHGQLNDIKRPLVGRSVDMDRDTIWGRINTTLDDWFAPDALKNTGPYKAVVLRVEPTNADVAKPLGFLDYIYDLFGDEESSPSKLGKVTEVKARIPELHGHLPIPTEKGDPQSSGYKDHHKIDLHPTFTAESDRDEYSKVKPGDIILVDFGDKTNFGDPVYLTPLAVQQHIPPPYDPNAALGKQPCAPPTGMMGGSSLGVGAGSGVNHTGVGAEKIRARTAGSRAIMFGDSQMQGALGKALHNYVSSLGYTVLKASGIGSSDGRMYRAGSPVAAWIKPGKSKSPPSAGKWGFVSEALTTHKPDLVAVCLGGNGSGPGDARKLVDKIRSHSPNSRILWIGPPPATVITDMNKAQKVWGKSPLDPQYKVKQSKAQREKIANRIGQEVGSLPNVFYINTPAVLAPPGSAYTTNPGPGGDGIHCTKAGAVDLLNRISKKASPPAAGPITPQHAQNKPKHPNSPTPGPGGAPAASVHAKLSSVYKKISQKWSNKEQATKFLQEKADKLGLGEATMEGLRERDWVSGFAVSDGHVKKGTVSLAKWKPARLSEIAAWGNFSSWPKTTIPESGVEVIMQGRTGPGTTADGSDWPPGDNPIKDKNEAMNLIKTISYDMAAASYISSGGSMETSPDTNPMTSTSNPTSPCPVGSVGAGGEAYSGGGGGARSGSRGKYGDQEAASICKRVNACLQQHGHPQIEVAALMAFMAVESGFRKPHPGLVRFEPHVWYDRGGAQGIPYRAGRSKCPEGYGGKGCGKKTRVDYTGSHTNRAAFDRAAKINLKTACLSTSWGSFQVMGFNLGPIIKNAFGGSYDKFVQQFDSDPDELNVKMVCHFIGARPRLQRALANKDWTRVSKIYNGSTAYASKFVPAYNRAKSSGVA